MKHHEHHGGHHGHHEEHGHHRHKRKGGGRTAHHTGKAHGHPESPEKGDEEFEADEKSKPMDYTAHSNVPKEAEEHKHGGRAKRHKRKCGGKTGHEMHAHHEHGTHHHKRKHKMAGKTKHHVGSVEGHGAHHHAGRKPRKSGGRAACEASPFTSAHHGEPAPGRKVETKFDD